MWKITKGIFNGWIVKEVNDWADNILGGIICYGLWVGFCSIAFGLKFNTGGTIDRTWAFIGFIIGNITFFTGIWAIILFIWIGMVILLLCVLVLIVIYAIFLGG